MLTKKIAAERAAEYVQDGMVVGLGTGSTAYWAILKIAERVRQGLNIKAIATSSASEKLALESGIPLVGFDGLERIDLSIDGADEIDGNLNLIKGGGGALLREKIIASASSRFIVIADERKMVATLGKFPLPVEVVPFGWEITLRKLEKLGCKPARRSPNGQPWITDNGNYIVDCTFGSILLPEKLEKAINFIPGVVDNGLFVQMAERAIVGYNDGTVREFVAKK